MHASLRALPEVSAHMFDPEVPKADGDEPQFEVYPEEGKKRMMKFK